MNWLSLSFGQVAALSGALAALALWLYLRRPRPTRVRVSTLRFWVSAPAGSSTAPRWKLRERWAFTTQILFLLLLIVALGNPRWGVTLPSRNVVIVLDAGAWSQTHPSGSPSWLDSVRSEALNLLAQLPPSDRVLLLRADAEGAPILPFTTDRNALQFAIRNLQPSSTVANIPKALSQGRAALSTGPRGLLAYIGPGLVDEKQARELDDFRRSLTPPSEISVAQQPPPQFLVRLVGDSSVLHNHGITDLSLKRSGSGPDEWSVTTRLKNYEDVPSKIVLSLSVDGHVFKQDRLSLAAGAIVSQADQFTSRSGGLLQAEITPADELAADNRAAIQLPSSQSVAVAVVTSRAAFAAKMHRVLAADPYVKAAFASTVAELPASADVVVYDGAAPAGGARGIISFVQPGNNQVARRVRLGNWNSAHPVTRWIQSRDVSVRAAGSLKAEPGDVVLASIASGPSEPLLLAREAGGQRSVIADFDPTDSNFTDEPAFPLLVAASIEWMTRTVGEQSASLFAGPLELPHPVSRVIAPSGHEVLFASGDSAVHLFAAESGLYRVVSGSETVNVPVNVPALPSLRWLPTPAETAAPETEPIAAEQRELWRWLLPVALVALWSEWWLFYIHRTNRVAEQRPKRSDSDARPEAAIPTARAS